ncbi:alpha/beta hydrolase [Motilimonas eburnea]|nr:alpha/beta hydrolase [Motilimonas eburnea]
MIIDSGYVDVMGSKIYYQVAGNKEGKPLLMLHGGLGSMHELTPIQQGLGQDFMLINVDLRGHGQSPLGHFPLSYQRYQQDVEAVLRHLAIDRYAVFGFSDGGIVGYRLAAQQPNQVSHLITLGAQWRYHENDPGMQLLASLTADFWRTRFAHDVALYERLNPQPHFTKLVDAVKQAWFDSTGSGYPGQQVTQIQCPTLVIRGDSDFIFSLAEAVALKAKITNCHLANLPLATHGAHQEHPDLVGMMVQRFLSRSNKSLGRAA